MDAGIILGVLVAIGSCGLNSKTTTVHRVNKRESRSLDTR
jgi:hypothetical protein